MKLTGRELAVLQLVAAGLTNKAIAAQLGITYGTVQNHLQHIRGKLGCEFKNRICLVRAAERADLLGASHA